MNFVVVGLFLKNRRKTAYTWWLWIGVCECAFLYVEGALRGRGSGFLGTQDLFIDGF